MKGNMKNKDLNKLIKKIKQNVFYNKKYSGVNISSLDEAPFIDSDDIQDIYSHSRRGGSTVFFTSGTTDDPKSIYYGDGDIDYMTSYIKWFCDTEGANKKEVVLVLMDQAFWGVGYMTGLGHIEAGNTVIPVDNDLSPQKIKEIIDAVKPTVISSLPSVLLEIKDYIDDYKFKIIETTGEILSKEDRKEIEIKYGGEVFDAYGLTEAIIGIECKKHDGYHYDQEKVYLEIVDPATKDKKQDGEWGELVVTTINYKEESTLVVRYLTGDKCKLSKEKCGCGLKHPKVWIEDRVNPTIKLHEGYKMEINEIENILKKSLNKEFESDVSVEKVSESKYLLIIKTNVNITEKERENITDNFVKYSYELMHMIRNKKLSFKFIYEQD